MAIEIGTCCVCQVTRIAAYGAFVSLETDGCAVSGMIHISEVSAGYVKDIADVLSVGDTCTAKILSVDERGRIALSRRQAMSEEAQAAERAALSGTRYRGGTVRGEHKTTLDCRHMPAGTQSPAHTADGDFEEMLRRFRVAREERLGALRGSAERGRGHRKRGY